jgi:hypothetical protein
VPPGPRIRRRAQALREEWAASGKRGKPPKIHWKLPPPGPAQPAAVVEVLDRVTHKRQQAWDEKTLLAPVIKRLKRAGRGT